MKRRFRNQIGGPGVLPPPPYPIPISTPPSPTVGCMTQGSDNYIYDASVVGGQTADDSCVRTYPKANDACAVLFQNLVTEVSQAGYDEEYAMSLIENRMMKVLKIWWLTTEQTPLAIPSGGDIAEWVWPIELQNLRDEWMTYIESKDFEIIGDFHQASNPSQYGLWTACTWVVPTNSVIFAGGLQDYFGTSPELRDFGSWLMDVIGRDDDSLWTFDYIPSPSELENWQTGSGPMMGTRNTPALWQGKTPKESTGYGHNTCERAKPLGSEVCGCTDPSANNYDPNANTDIVAELSTNPSATMCQYGSVATPQPVKGMKKIVKGGKKRFSGFQSATGRDSSGFVSYGGDSFKNVEGFGGTKVCECRSASGSHGYVNVLCTKSKWCWKCCRNWGGGVTDDTITRR